MPTPYQIKKEEEERKRREQEAKRLSAQSAPKKAAQPKLTRGSDGKTYVNLNDLTDESAASLARRMKTDEERDAFLTRYVGHVGKKTSANYRADAPTMDAMRSLVDSGGSGAIYASTRNAIKQTMGAFDGMIDVGGEAVNMNTADANTVIRAIRATADDDMRKSRAKAFETLVKTPGSRFYGAGYDAEMLDTFLDSAQLSAQAYKEYVKDFSSVFYPQAGKEAENREAYGKLRTQIEALEDGYLRQTYLTALDKAYLSQTGSDALPDMALFAKEQEAAAQEAAAKQAEQGEGWLEKLIKKLVPPIEGVYETEESPRNAPPASVPVVTQETGTHNLTNLLPSEEGAQAPADLAPSTGVSGAAGGDADDDDEEENGKSGNRAMPDVGAIMEEYGGRGADLGIGGSTAHSGTVDLTGDLAQAWGYKRSGRFNELTRETQMELAKMAGEPGVQAWMGYIDDNSFWRFAYVAPDDTPETDADNPWYEAGNERADSIETGSLHMSLGAKMLGIYAKINADDFPEDLRNMAFMTGVQLLRSANEWQIESGFVAEDGSNVYDAYIAEHPNDPAWFSLNYAIQLSEVRKEEARRAQEESANAQVRDAQKQLEIDRAAYESGNYTQQQYDNLRSNAPEMTALVLNRDRRYIELYNEIENEWNYTDSEWMTDTVLSPAVRINGDAEYVKDRQDTYRAIAYEYLTKAMLGVTQMAYFLGYDSLAAYEKKHGEVTLEALHSMATLDMQRFASSITQEDVDAVQEIAQQTQYSGTGEGVSAWDVAGSGMATGASDAVSGMLGGFYTMTANTNLPNDIARARIIYNKEFGFFAETQLKADLLEMAQGGYFPQEGMGEYITEYLNAGGNPFSLGIVPGDFEFARKTAVKYREVGDAYRAWAKESMRADQGKWFERVAGATDNAVRMTASSLMTLGTGSKVLGLVAGYGMSSYAEGAEGIYAQDAQYIRETGALPTTSTMKWANFAGLLQMSATVASEYVTFGNWLGNVAGFGALKSSAKAGLEKLGASGTARLMKGLAAFSKSFGKQMWDEVFVDETTGGLLSYGAEEATDRLRALDENGTLSLIRGIDEMLMSAGAAIYHTDEVLGKVVQNAPEMAWVVGLTSILGAGGAMHAAMKETYEAAEKAVQTGDPRDIAAFTQACHKEVAGASEEQLAAADAALTDAQIAETAVGIAATDPAIAAQIEGAADAQRQADAHRESRDASAAQAKAGFESAAAALDDIDAGDTSPEAVGRVADGMDAAAKGRQGEAEHERARKAKQDAADKGFAQAMHEATDKARAQVAAQQQRATTGQKPPKAATAEDGESTKRQERMAQIEARMDEIGALYEANPELEDPALDEESEQLANEYGALQEAQEAAGRQTAAPMPEGMEEDAPLFESERGEAAQSETDEQETAKQRAYEQVVHAQTEYEALEPVFEALRTTGVYVNDSQKANILHATGLKSLQQVNFRYGFKLTNDVSKGAMPLDGHFFAQLAEDSGGRLQADELHPEEKILELGERKKTLRADIAEGKKAMQASVGETIHEAYVEDAGAYYGTKDPVTQQMASDIYKSTGLTVVVAPLANQIRAVYDRANGRVILSNRIGAGLAKAQAAMHELTHYIEGSSGYEAYKKAALDAAYFGDTDGVMQGADAEQIRDTYAESGITLDEAGVESELVAQATEKIIADESGEIVRRLLSQGKRGFVVRLKNLLMQFLARRKAKREGRLAQYDAIQNAYKLFRDALESRGKWAQGEAGTDVTVDLDAAKRQQGEAAYGAVGEQMQYAIDQSAAHYDYAKPFSEQVDDWLTGRIPKGDMLLLGGTPQVLRDIGLSDLPLAIDQAHMRKMLQSPKNDDHNLGIDVVKSLPSLLQDPVAIIESADNLQDSLFVIVVPKDGEMKGVPIVAAINTQKGGAFNKISVTPIRLMTAHARGDLTKRIEDAVAKEISGRVGVYYVKKEAIPTLEAEQLQELNKLDRNGFIHSIHEDDSPVKHTYLEQAQTQQFRRWIKGSYFRNPDGTPIVMYRGGNQQINVFDRKKSSHSNLYGRGFYFTADESTARSYGEVERFYLSVKKPLDAASGKRDITPEQLRRFLEAVAEDEDYGIENYGYGATVDSVAKSLRGKNDFDVLQDINATCIGDFVAAIELFNRVNGTNYDGIVTPTETVVFRSEQIKSADRNVGLFDPLNPDVRYALAPNQFGNETAQRMTTINQTVRDVLSGSEHEVVTNQARLDAAWEKVNADGLDTTAGNLLAKGDWDAQDNATAALCMVLASQRGDETTAAAIAMRLDTEGSKQGQAMQVRQMFLRLTPEGAMGEMIRKAERINQGAGIPAGSFPVGEGAPKTGGTTTDEATGTKTMTPPKAQDVYDEADSLQAQLDALPGDVSTNNPWSLPLADWQMALIKKFRLTGVKLPGINYNIATKKQRMLAAIIATDQRVGKDAQKALCQQLVAIDKNHAVVTAADLRYEASQIAEFKALEGADAVVPSTQAGREALGRAMQAQDNIIPVGFLKKWASLRYLNMLSVPATAVRNVASNVISGGLETVSTGIATIADRSIAKKTGNRTTSLPTKAERSEANRAFAAEIARTISDYLIAHVDTGHGRKYDVGGQGRVFETEWLEACRNFVDFTMQIGDRPFYEKTYAQELAIIKRLGMKTYETKDGKRVQRPMTEAEMHAEATVRALHRVYQENSEMAEIVAKLRGMNPTMDLIISTLVPFVKTPTNVAMRAMEYSPVGLANALIRRAIGGIDTGALGSISQRDYVMGIGRGLTGTGLLTAGVLLAAAGYLKFGRGEEENKNRREVLTSLYEPYGMYIEIGGQKREIDWALPASAALAMGAELVRGLDDGEGFVWALATAIVSGLGDQLMDTPMLSGLSEIFRGYDDTEDMLIRLAKTEATSLMNQTFSPSIIRAIAKAIDPYVRDTSSQSEVMSILSGSVVQYWPLLRQMLPAKTDVTGEKMLQSGYYSWGKETQNAALHMLDSFFTPTATIGEKNDEALFELLDLSYRLQQEGESFTLPAALVGENGRLNVTKTLAGKTGTGDAGYTIQLTDDQRREANRLYGDLLFNGMRGVSYTMPNGVKKYDASDLTGIRVMIENGEWAVLTDKERADKVDKMRAKAKEIVTLMAIRGEL